MNCCIFIVAHLDALMVVHLLPQAFFPDLLGSSEKHACITNFWQHRVP
ncbi:hypothetical protein V6Z12_D07G072400 [Gossypium hirsutum]